MFEGLWRSVQRRFILLAVRRFGRQTAAQEFDLQGAWDRVRRVLVCWPGVGMDLLAARVVLNRVRERFPNASLTVLALPGVGASPPNEVEAEVISVKQTELSLFGVPQKRLRDMLRDAGYDAVVDLSPRFEPLAGYFCLATQARLRIGFAGPSGDLVYNYQVAPRSDRSGIDRYRVLARYIG